MNILVEKETGFIKHQNMKYILLEDKIKVYTMSDQLAFIFSTLNIHNCDVVEIDEKIEMFEGNKYIYKDGVVGIDPEWTEYIIEEE